MNSAWFRPDWPAPQNVKSVCTTRLGGVSLPPYDSLNLATHVGDAPELVLQNRQYLINDADLPQEPTWLDQQHTDLCIHLPLVAENALAGSVPVADAAWTGNANQLCTVMTADCLPILLCDLVGSKVVAVHAGWRGVHQCIIEKSVRSAGLVAGQFIAWIGPAIHQAHFEVGGELLEAFCQLNPDYERFFKRSEQKTDKFLADLIGMAREQLLDSGCKAVYGGNLCSYSDETRFFSYRRDGRCGRMATIIWLD
ncbi:peptidoglycan editing factor PgeF [Thiomicrorhabdus sp.]|uniref:peptidoglycan editing factor PgeF n=1 Tax=Thiomicrorhabdus sp. TaxID=2039724 RepID=UPI0029C852DE|nr:peptidoglycan editing factor PgeF [Thiomicrorhabdus sp.]